MTLRDAALRRLSTLARVRLPGTYLARAPGNSFADSSPSCLQGAQSARQYSTPAVFVDENTKVCPR